MHVDDVSADGDMNRGGNFKAMCSSKHRQLYMGRVSAPDPVSESSTEAYAACTLFG